MSNSCCIAVYANPATKYKKFSARF